MTTIAPRPEPATCWDQAMNSQPLKPAAWWAMAVRTEPKLLPLMKKSAEWCHYHRNIILMPHKHICVSTDRRGKDCRSVTVILLKKLV